MAKNFRKQTIERLCATAYVSMDIADSRLDEIAERIGVQPDVLVEARVRHRIGAKALGRSRFTERERVALSMPEVVWNAWLLEVEDRGVERETLLRSVIHAYLLSSYEPPEVIWGWRFDGKLLHTNHRNWEIKNKKRWPWMQTAKMPPGAMRALELRGKARGSGATAIARALVLEIMAGRWRDVRLVDQRVMSDDERQYYLGAASALLADPNEPRNH